MSHKLWFYCFEFFCIIFFLIGVLKKVEKFLKKLSKIFEKMVKKIHLSSKIFQKRYIELQIFKPFSCTTTQSFESPVSGSSWETLTSCVSESSGFSSGSSGTKNINQKQYESYYMTHCLSYLRRQVLLFLQFSALRVCLREFLHFGLQILQVFFQVPVLRTFLRNCLRVLLQFFLQFSFRFFLLVFHRSFSVKRICLHYLQLLADCHWTQWLI